MTKPEIPPEATEPRDHKKFCAPATCERCGGSGVIDSGGFTPWSSPIDLPCPACNSKWDDLVQIGAAWRQDSSLEKWFPFTFEEIKKLRELNEDKFKTINAYCKAASLDKWKIGKLVAAIDQYISAAGYSEHTKILTEARADVVNSSSQ